MKKTSKEERIKQIKEEMKEASKYRDKESKCLSKAWRLLEDLK